MEQFLNQPIDVLLQENFQTVMSKVLAGVLLWYLTGAFLICHSWADEVFADEKELKPTDKNMGYLHMPFIWLFSPLLFVYLVVWVICFIVSKLWIGFSYLLLPSTQREQVRQFLKQ